MAMTMNGQVQLPASREVVWAKLNDPVVLKSCIPGSEQLDRRGLAANAANSGLFASRQEISGSGSGRWGIGAGRCG
jgi:hypothetical protein